MTPCVYNLRLAIMEMMGHLVNARLRHIMSKSLLISRTLINCSIFVSEQKRKDATKIAYFRVQREGMWVFHVSMIFINKTIIVELVSKCMENIAYCGLNGTLYFSEDNHADIEIKILKNFKHYVITVNSPYDSWDVQLSAYNDGEKWIVNIYRKNELIITSPSKQDGWLEEMRSFFKFIKYHWGDIVCPQLEIDIQSQEIIAVLFCIGIHNSIVGTQIMTDYPNG